MDQIILMSLNQCNLKVPFFWTGDQVIHSDYASRKINLWKKNFSKDRKIIIWDNTFANDYCTPKIVFQEYENPPIDNDELDGFLINATGIKAFRYSIFGSFIKLFSNGE